MNIQHDHRLKQSLTALFLMIVLVGPAQSEEELSTYVDNDRNISFLSSFRASMIHLGSWFVPLGDTSGIHDLFTEKESFDEYRKTGQLPDGATMVKVLRASEPVDYATGTRKLRFLMIKDQKGKFKDNPLWVVGWGRAVFDSNSQTHNDATDYQAAQRILNLIVLVAISRQKPMIVYVPKSIRYCERIFCLSKSGAII